MLKDYQEGRDKPAPKVVRPAPEAPRATQNAPRRPGYDHASTSPAFRKLRAVTERMLPGCVLLGFWDDRG